MRKRNLRGGGGYKLNSKPSIFKPIIASSLALALGVSVGNGQDHSGSGDITGVGEHNILSGSYSGNIKRPNGSGDMMTVNVGTTSKVIFTGSIGGNELNDPKTADLVVNFLNGSTLQGNIETAANYFAENRVTFTSGASTSSLDASNNFVMTGNIISRGTGYGSGYLGTENGNHIVFEQGSMKGNIEVSRDPYRRLGYNEVTFKQQGAILEGKIIASGSAPSSNNENKQATNKVSFTNGGIVRGEIRADHSGLTNDPLAGKNVIDFSGNSRSSIEGSINAQAGTNNITFSGTSANTICKTNFVGCLFVFIIR